MLPGGDATNKLQLVSQHVRLFNCLSRSISVSTVQPNNGCAFVCMGVSKGVVVAVVVVVVCVCVFLCVCLCVCVHVCMCTFESCRTYRPV